VKMDDKHEPKRSAAEIALTELHAGGKFNQNSYKVSGGLHGVGVSCVNALSKWLRLTVRRDGKVHQLEFARGFVQNRISDTVDGFDTSPMKVTGATDKRGTEVHFLPDTDIFTQNNDFHYDDPGQAPARALVPEQRRAIRLKDERTGKEDDFAYAGGVKGFVDFINAGQEGAAPQHLPRPWACGRQAMSEHSRHRASAWKWPCSGTTATTSRCSASPTTSPSATAAPT
jgi:DNA gyrase subunit B